MVVRNNNIQVLKKKNDEIVKLKREIRGNYGRGGMRRREE
jgi:hypothetical protein